MGQVTMFECDHCKTVWKKEELLLKCQEFHRAQKELGETREKFETVKREFENAQQKVRESCPGHDYQSTGNSRQDVTMTDTRYTSREMRCSRCGHEYWT